MEKVFIKTLHVTEIRCPKCGKSRTVNVSKYFDRESPVRLRCVCICGNSFISFLERRKWPRKKTNFPGVLTQVVNGTAVKNWLILVENLSRSGLGLRLVVNPNGALTVGEKVVVRFFLENERRKMIVKEVNIRRIKDNNLGVEFTPPDLNGRNIGFFKCRIGDTTIHGEKSFHADNSTIDLDSG